MKLQALALSAIVLSGSMAFAKTCSYMENVCFGQKAHHFRHFKAFEYVKGTKTVKTYHEGGGVNEYPGYDSLSGFLADHQVCKPANRADTANNDAHEWIAENIWSGWENVAENGWHVKMVRLARECEVQQAEAQRIKDEANRKYKGYKDRSDRLAESTDCSKTLANLCSGDKYGPYGNAHFRSFKSFELLKDSNLIIAEKNDGEGKVFKGYSKISDFLKKKHVCQNAHGQKVAHLERTHRTMVTLALACEVDPKKITLDNADRPVRAEPSAPRESAPSAGHH